MQACCWCFAWFCIDSIFEGSSQVHRVSSMYLHNYRPSIGSRVPILAVSTWVLPGDLLEWVQGRKGLTVPIRFNNRQGAPYLEDCSLCAAPNLSLNPVRKREELSGADWAPSSWGEAESWLTGNLMLQEKTRGQLVVSERKGGRCQQTRGLWTDGGEWQEEAHPRLQCKAEGIG